VGGGHDVGRVAYLTMFVCYSWFLPHFYGFYLIFVLDFASCFRIYAKFWLSRENGYRFGCSQTFVSIFTNNLFCPFQIIDLCLKYITYDPNYNYDDDENGSITDDDVAMVLEEDGDDDENDEYSDDDDMSWKIRRSAAKCLEAVIATRRELLADFYRTVSPALIARFKGTNIPADQPEKPWIGIVNRGEN